MGAYSVEGVGTQFHPLLILPPFLPHLIAEIKSVNVLSKGQYACFWRTRR